MINAAPTKMKAVRAMREKTMPKSRTFCWSSRGTRKLAMMIRKTKRLSTDNAFSVMYPAKYSAPISMPPKTSTTTPKIKARPT
ncbi:hypothetical protein D3C74_414810 [compost metagenome]